MTTPAETVNSFMRAWEALDVEWIIAHFSGDAVYHNIPLPPMRGKAELKPLIGKLVAPMDGITFDVSHAAASGDLVMNERGTV